MVNKKAFALCLTTSLIVLAVASWKFLANKSEVNNRRIKRYAEAEVKADKKYATFDDWVNGVFSSKSFYPNWISGDLYLSRSDDGAIMRVNITDGSEEIFLDSTAWTSLESPYTYSISADGMYVAIQYQKTDGYAHYVQTFSVAIFESGSGNKVNIPDFPTEKIQKIKWSPTEHKFAYVYDFNVFVNTNFTSASTPLTSDGKENEIFNGITDWLHYVEITDDDALLWWSPDSKYLVLAKLDQDQVKDFDFNFYGAYDNQYSPMISFPYPKPGTPIPKTTLYVTDTDAIPVPTPTKVDPSSDVTDWGDYYLNSLMWRNATVFSPTWKNRYENQSVSDSCFEGTWICDHASGEGMVRSSSTGWLGVYKPADLMVTGNDDEFLTIYSNNGFMHIAFIKTVTGNVDFRTSGEFEATSIAYYDVDNDNVYYISTEMNDGSEKGLPRIRHMWKVKGHGTNKQRTCITCDLNTEYPDRCNWVNPSFSTDGSYVVVNCGGTGNGIPISTLHSISGEDIMFKRVVQNNDNLQKNMNNYYFRERIYGNLTLPDVDDVWYYALHLPPNFDSAKKYPLFVQVYSGPSYQYVTDYYNADWARGYVASSDLDVVVMTFDGRGTGYRGDEIMHKVYRQLGKFESMDQIEAASQILDKYSYLDKNKVAIWGRSYGGYMTSRIIEEDANTVFKCGFSVAPVIDWMFYHTIYTERYMGSPYNDNEQGYKESTALQKLDNIGKHKFYLVHGTGDENVHFQNSARMSMALIEKDIDFGAYFAADETHSFNRGSNGYKHHYKLLTRHLKECFGKL